MDFHLHPKTGNGIGQLAFSVIPRGAFFGFFLVSSTAAMADTSTLVCHLTPFVIVEDEPTTIDLNEAQSSVVVHFGALHQTFPQTASPAMTVGPLAAVFGVDTISFSQPGAPYQGDYILNRLTGGLVNTSTNWRYTCQLGQKQF